jgi:hypothetical protein
VSAPRCSADLNAVCRLDSSDPAASEHLVAVAAEDVPVERAWLRVDALAAVPVVPV